MQKGQKVRLKADPGRVGYSTGKTRDIAGRVYYQIDFINRSEYHAEDQLEPADVPLDPIERLREGQLGRVYDLRRTLTHARLSGRLANLIYSMETTNTDFYAYQFKPVLKLLNSPTKGILIADEVGLGKTIEAGLVWTELRSRFEERRLMVLCLAMLRPKWQRELRNRFGIDAEVLGAEDVLSQLERVAGDESYSSFSIVSSMQGLRPRRGWNSSEQSPDDSASRLARFLEERTEEEPLIDLLVIDEAHYLRNPESMTNVLARLLCAVSNRALLLSATPVHLRSADLYYLLNLVDPDTFNQSAVFDSVLDANAPIIKARDAVVAGEDRRERILEMLSDAQKHPYLRENRQLRSLIDELENDDPPLRDHDYRSKLVFRLDGVNMLNNVVTRTRKREIHEWRVVREPTAQKVPMSEPEREFYQRVTTLLREFCLQYRQHEGFLLVMPQRQMSSSMPAALGEWKRRRALYDEEYFEDFGVEDVEPPGPILEEIFRNLESLGDLDMLWKNDSKFAELVRSLKALFAKNANEKVVVFSYFKATLHYLAERLGQEGLSAAVLSGDSDINKDEVLSRFEAVDGARILLSSEVGSEGVDLQFCRVVINYDLPWNPMRVEQRIGRLDRIGQSAKKILIWNLMYDDTIDSRIYDRLYDRLKIFEYALGGLEPILGDEIRKLTNELLRGQLTPEQERQQIDQSAMALANIRNEEERLESEAVSLVAHGDYILQQVRAARELKRWISGQDIQAYVVPFLRERYPGCRFEQVSVDDSTLYDIALSDQAKHDFEEFLRGRRLLGTTALTRSDPAPVRCRFENKVAPQHRDRTETISQLHPVVRFVSQQLEATERVGYPAVSVTVGHAEVPAEITPGTYVFGIQCWSVEGVQLKEQISFSAARLDGGMPELNERAAEQLVVSAAMTGVEWIEAPHTVDHARAADVATRLCLDIGEQSYQAYVTQVTNENHDRADVQEKTLRRHLEEQERQLERIKAEHVAAGRLSLAQATEGRLGKLRGRVQRQLLKINEGRSTRAHKQDVCVGVIQVREAK